jgi:rare lipoprotein A
MRSSESDDTAQTMEGRATWYGPGLYGNKTASGEVLKARAFPTLNSAREGEL